MTDHRDLAAWCETRILDREYQTATVVTTHGPAKALANEVELVTGMARAAYDEAMDLADAHEHEGAR